MRMVPHPRPGHQVYTEVEESALKAGVLLLLFPRDGRLHLVLTRRTDRVEFHKGQISLPGGRCEPGESPEETALRETREELGIDTSPLRILGRLTPLYVPPSNYCIYPVAAVLEERPEFRPFPLEVEEVLEVPLDHLLDPENTRREQWTVRGKDMEVPYFSFGEHKIWGATAMVLAEFLELLRHGPTS